ncbi:hypothetical protein CLV47_102285 [Antricoccus suffuscus]|uniref:Uncharacterized protein n=1 Tax=Antricoccus suffuscus TaxID=1629062 RepID=A0A2T1A4R7_9ACTN|nr:hypothetical protein [Antricoccus suffuscus]PRZ43595.1 hypothetical protein CLV47_102285 [Antricoccus suffuscus]
MADQQLLDVPEMDGADWFEYALGEGWSDGLPVVPPTVELVDRMIEATSNYGALPELPPSRLTGSIESFAANAVMAGCRPVDFPVVLAGLRAVASEAYNLHGTLATTHPCAQFMMVNGPVRDAVELNCGTNCLGQGTRANAVIGRALQLILRNVGGAIPGVMDRSTQGSPAKYAYCFGENEEDSPWQPYHVRAGYASGDSTVTAMAAEGPHNINDHGSNTGIGILQTVAGVMGQPGSNQSYVRGPHFVLFGIEHAATLARDHWNPDTIREWLFDNARIPAERISEENKQQFADHGIETVAGEYTVSTGPDMINVAVAGGFGKHSAWVPSFGGTAVITEKIISD